MNFTVCKLLCSDFRRLTQDSLKFEGDDENCCLISPTHLKDVNSKGWAILSSKTTKATRKIHSLGVKNVSPNCIFVKEDVYHNICKDLGENADSNEFQALLEAADDEIEIAAIVKLAPIVASCQVASADDDLLLSSYFAIPRFLYSGDLVAVPLSSCLELSKSASYHDLEHSYYKVIFASLEINADKKQEEICSKGFYVLQGYTSLYCVPIQSSFLPSKPEFMIPPCSSLPNDEIFLPTIPRVPPDLSNYVQQLKRIFKPFTKSSRPECLPFFMLTGIRGSGKMASLRVAAEEMGLHLFAVNSYEFYGVGVSAVEAKLGHIFQRAAKIGPCVLAITGFELMGRDKGGMEDSRLVSSFLDYASKYLNKTSEFPQIFVGVSDSKSEEILPSIARAILHTIKFSVPTIEETAATLSWFTKCKGYDMTEESLRPVVKKLVGYVHADLKLLIDCAVRFMFEEKGQHGKLAVNHFEKGIEQMEAAYSDTIGAAKVPSVRWDDVGGLSAIKEEVMLTLDLPLRRPGLLGGNLRRSGILFYGPPGTGKTLMAKAVATECAMNFLSVKGPELMNMYVGQSEKNVREVFERGREAAPCILFFDELDSLAPNRGKSGDGGGVTDRVVSQLLAEMDGLQSNRGLFVIAATNRPDLVDPALLRPGRFDKMFYLGPCTDVDSKFSVLQALTNKFILSPDVDLREVTELMPEQVTGADVYSVCSNAWLAAARRQIADLQKGGTAKLPLEVTTEDFSEGVKCMVPSLTDADLRYYQQLAETTTSNR